MTLDGQRITLNINAGLIVDLPHLSESGADGIGLFRTELQFMLSRRFPRLEQQAGLYMAVLSAAGEKPVVFRTLDIGSDKTLPYLHVPREDNPALGWRAIRYALERPALLRLQARALLRAGSGRDLRIMFPMVAEVAEFINARSAVLEERAFLERQGHPPPRSLMLGAMIEVPSLLFQLDAFLAEVDFVSIGSNDLMQFLFASDRGHPKLAGRYDPLSPPGLNALRFVVERARAFDVPINLCGEMAGRPLEAMALTHTCYNGQRPPCGECAACSLRAKGFAEAGLKDPLVP